MWPRFSTNPLLVKQVSNTGWSYFSFIMTLQEFSNAFESSLDFRSSTHSRFQNNIGPGHFLYYYQFEFHFELIFQGLGLCKNFPCWLSFQNGSFESVISSWKLSLAFLALCFMFWINGCATLIHFWKTVFLKLHFLFFAAYLNMQEKLFIQCGGVVFLFFISVILSTIFIFK